MISPVEFTVQIPPFLASTGGVNQILKLPTWVPDPCQITRVIMWSQNEDFPSDASGDITLAIDPFSDYCINAGFPAHQLTAPNLSKTIGMMFVRPGQPRGIYTDFATPILYSNAQNDSIIFAPETGGAFDIQMDLGFQFLSPADIVIPTGTNVYSLTLDSQTTNSGIAIRDVATCAGIAGCKARVRVSAGAAGFYCNSASIGIRSGETSTMAAAPIPLTFQGQAWCYLPSGFLWSDWVTLIKAPEDQLLVSFDMFNVSNTWAYKATATDGNYSAPVANSGNATMAGAVTWQANRTHIVDRIEIM